MKSRDSMILYRSFYDAIKLLPDGTQLEIFRAIFDYGLDGNEPELSKEALPFWLLIKPNLLANRTKWESGCKAKSKQDRSKTEAEAKQSISKAEAEGKQEASKTEANVDVDVDEDEEVDVRSKIDISDLSSFESKYDKSMLSEFQAYWTEKNSKGKMRYQAEKYFDISRRLATWARNQSSFSKNKKEASHYVPAEKPGEWRPPHHKLLDFSGTIETR